MKTHKLTGFFRNLYKTIKLNKFYHVDVQLMDVKEELNLIVLNFISLTNEGEYQRFNSYDFYAKSSKIKIICNSISKLQAYRDQFPNERTTIRNLINSVTKMFHNLEDPLEAIFKMIELRTSNEKEIFIEVRNLIASEWIKRNKNNPNSIIHKTLLKDLNYLNYTLDEYKEYLNNCLNLLIRDTQKFISRYPLEYKINQELDIEIIMSLRDSIYNDVRFVSPYDVPSVYNPKISDDFNIFKIVEPSTKRELILRGWFKDKPNNCKIQMLKYKAYKKSI